MSSAVEAMDNAIYAHVFERLSPANGRGGRGGGGGHHGHGHGQAHHHHHHHHHHGNGRRGPRADRVKKGNTARYKTELCRAFQETSTCKYGDKCQFAHGEAELRPLARHPKYKTEMCRTYHTTGLCPYGPRCHFIHEATEANTGSTGPPSYAPPSDQGRYARGRPAHAQQYVGHHGGHGGHGYGQPPPPEHPGAYHRGHVGGPGMPGPPPQRHHHRQQPHHQHPRHQHPHPAHQPHHPMLHGHPAPQPGWSQQPSPPQHQLVALEQSFAAVSMSGPPPAHIPVPGVSIAGPHVMFDVVPIGTPPTPTRLPAAAAPDRTTTTTISTAVTTAALAPTSPSSSTVTSTETGSTSGTSRSETSDEDPARPTSSSTESSAEGSPRGAGMPGDGPDSPKGRLPVFSSFGHQH